MTQPKHPPRRPNAEYRWSIRKARAFLDALVDHGNVAAAARAVGMSRQSAYRLRARLDADFSRFWGDALKLSVQVRREREANELIRRVPHLLTR